MRRSRKTYSTPLRPWDRERLKREKDIVAQYGLKSKKELWKFENKLRNFRRSVRGLIAEENKEKGESLMKKLKRLGILGEKERLDDVLNLTINNLLERRLQTIVYRKGFAKSIKQARQMIVHGHISIKGRKVTVPSYIVRRDEEGAIELSQKMSHMVAENE